MYNRGMIGSGVTKIRQHRMLGGFFSVAMLKKINRVLAFAAGGLLLLFVWRAVVEKSPEGLMRNLRVKTHADNAAVTAFTLSARPPLSFDGELFSRSIYKSAASNSWGSSPFPVGPGGMPMTAPSGPGAPSVSPEQVRLVGILPGATPQAVLEDPAQQKTYYLSKGQSEAGIVVEDIQADTVTVSIGGKTKQFST